MLTIQEQITYLQVENQALQAIVDQLHAENCTICEQIAKLQVGTSSVALQPMSPSGPKLMVPLSEHYDGTHNKFHEPVQALLPATAQHLPDEPGKNGSGYQPFNRQPSSCCRGGPTEMCQASRSAATYEACFQCLVVAMAWNEAAQLHQFHLDLSEEIKDELPCLEPPMDLDRFIELRLQIDTQISEC